MQIAYSEKAQIVDSVLREFKEMETRRGNHEQRWTEIAQRMLPNEWPMIQSQGQSAQNGEKRTDYVFDSTAMNALTKFSAALDSLLTPRGQRWHQLRFTDPILSRNRQARLWLEDVNEALFIHRYSAYSNFVGQMRGVYRGYGAFGFGPLMVDAREASPGVSMGIRYRHIPVYESYIGDNHQGIVNRMARRFSLKPYQVLEKFRDKASEEVRSKAAQNSQEPIWILHVVRPNPTPDPERADYRGWPFSSYYVEVATKTLLEESGYRTFPYPTARYDVLSGDVYPRSVADEALPTTKTLNEHAKTMLKAGHKAVDPPLLTHDNGILSTISQRPGALNRGGVSATGDLLVNMIPQGRYEVGKDLWDRLGFQTNDSFMLTLFQMALDEREMTATEVLERTREKAWILGPTLGNLESEFCGPLIGRELDVLSQLRLLPEAPPIVRSRRGFSYREEYDSPLARAAKADMAAGYTRSRDDAANMANVTGDPSHMDYLDTEKADREVAQIRGVPERWFRSEEDVAQRQAARREQVEQQTAIQAAPGAAALIKAQTGAAKAPKAV